MGALRQADCGVAILNGFGAANADAEEEKEDGEGVERTSGGGSSSSKGKTKQRQKQKKKTPAEAARRKREEQQRVRAAFQKALAAEIERRKAKDGAPASVVGWLRLCWGSYREVQRAFFGVGGDVASVARARLRMERLAMTGDGDEGACWWGLGFVLGSLVGGRDGGSGSID